MLAALTVSIRPSALFWRWSLIVSETVVAGYFVATLIAGRHLRQETGLLLGVGIVAFAAWMFLFVGSLFLVKSHRWLAILGWGIAVTAVLFPVL